VVPRQYVFADSSGAVLIPDSRIDEVLAEARKVEAADAASRDQIARQRVRVIAPLVAPRLFEARCSFRVKAGAAWAPGGDACPSSVAVTSFGRRVTDCLVGSEQH
jgi:hypothetical protein